MAARHSLLEWRDHRLALIEGVGDPYIRALVGSRLIREVAYITWCPACRDGDHFNHAKRLSSKGPKPKRGGCWSIANARDMCLCPWRPS